MFSIRCPYLDAEVECTDERWRHIQRRHPELLPEHWSHIERAIVEPDEIRDDPEDPDSRKFVRWFDTLKGGKFVVVVVVSSAFPERRHWIVTAFPARRPPKGQLLWKREKA